MIFRLRVILIASFCLGSQWLIPAQSSNFNFIHITTVNGLSSDKVESVIQDHEGFYWIATQNGLNRYNSSIVINMLTPDASSSAIYFGNAMSANHGGIIYNASTPF